MMPALGQLSKRRNIHCASFIDMDLFIVLYHLPLVEAIPVVGLLPVVEASERKWICEELDTFPAERLL